MTRQTVLQLEQLGFAWPQQPELLSIPHFSLHAGELVLLKGPSGSGKTTLLSLMTGVNQAQRGTLTFLGKDLATLSTAQRDRYRADHSGYIFQQFNLLPFLSVMANVCLPCRFSALRRQRARSQHGSVQQAAQFLLSQLGLPRALFSAPAQHLSIGQQQRVACARALIGQPELIIADEPTSALDTDSREAFLNLLFSQCRESAASLLFVSHDHTLAQHFDRSLDLAELNQACGAV